MKLILLTLFFCATLNAAPLQPSGNITLSWDYPTNELSTNLTFRVYSSTDIATPLTNWTVLTNMVGTNLSAPLKVEPGPHFFCMTASNFWGESDFSEVISTPRLPRSDVKMKVRKDEP